MIKMLFPPAGPINSFYSFPKGPKISEIKMVIKYFPVQKITAGVEFCFSIDRPKIFTAPKKIFVV